MRWKPIYFIARIDNSELLKEWNFNIQPDRLSNRQLHKPSHYEKLESIGLQDGRKFSERELVKYGLSLADFPKDEKEVITYQERTGWYHD